MKHIYSCPHCQATLNPNVKIVLTSDCGGNRGLLLLSPQPGNYEKIFSEELEFEDGDIVELFCPVCAASLTYEENPKLGFIDFRNDDGDHGHVCFSRTVGEHATWFVTSDEVSTYGEHAEDYKGVNWFGEGTATKI